jgi:hypothetical protein
MIMKLTLREKRARRRLAPVSCGLLLALLALAMGAVPWLPAPGGGYRAPAVPPALAAPLVHGRVFWEGTEEVVADVGLTVADRKSGQVVLTARTDATGWYTLTVGVGTWLVDVPSTDRYWGYAQEVTIMPHGEYLLDFAIAPRPPGQTQPPASLPTPVVPGLSPGATPAPGEAGPAPLPRNGQPFDPMSLLLVLVLALGSSGLGLLLRRGSPR